MSQKVTFPGTRIRTRTSWGDYYPVDCRWLRGEMVIRQVMHKVEFWDKADLELEI